jgi:hypothetical protein
MVALAGLSTGTWLGLKRSQSATRIWTLPALGVVLLWMVWTHGALDQRRHWANDYLPRHGELTLFVRWWKAAPSPVPVATFSYAESALHDMLGPQERLLAIPAAAQADPSAWLRQHGMHHVLWTSTEQTINRTARLNLVYAVQLRDAYGDLGLEGSFIQRVHEGKVRGWVPIQRFRIGDQQAVVYERVEGDPPGGDPGANSTR